MTTYGVHEASRGLRPRMPDSRRASEGPEWLPLEMSLRDGEAVGLENGTVRVVPYDERWPVLFERAAQEIREAVGVEALAVHHVGSTAVPGLASKPILDILVGVSNFDRAEDLVPKIEQLGYEYRPGEDIPDRHYFRRPRALVRTHHLSLAVPTSHHFRVTLAFRDALRGDPSLTAKYGQLKQDLAERYPRDREAYLEGKAAFVQEVLERAESRL